MLQRGAVVGRIFSWAAVWAISPEAEQGLVAGALEALMRKEFLFRDAVSRWVVQEAYQFGHILIRDTAYNGLPKENTGGAAREAAEIDRED